MGSESYGERRIRRGLFYSQKTSISMKENELKSDRWKVTRTMARMKRREIAKENERQVDEYLKRWRMIGGLLTTDCGLVSK